MIDHDAEGTDCCGKGISDLIRHSKKGSRLGCWPNKGIYRNSQMHPDCSIAGASAERFAGCVCCFEPVMISYKYQNVRRAVYALL